VMVTLGSGVVAARFAPGRAGADAGLDEVASSPPDVGGPGLVAVTIANLSAQAVRWQG
jgi:hypothetical protein